MTKRGTSGRKQLCRNQGIPEESDKKTKNLTVASVPAKIQNGHLPKISLQQYHYTNLLGGKFGLNRWYSIIKQKTTVIHTNQNSCNTDSNQGTNTHKRFSSKIIQYYNHCNYYQSNFPIWSSYRHNVQTKVPTNIITDTKYFMLPYLTHLRT